MPTKKLPNPLQGQYAGFISRAIAFMIDLLIITGVIVVVSASTTLLLTAFGLVDVVQGLLDSNTILGTALRVFTAIYGITFIAVSYFVLLWVFSSGQTIGNAVIGLRVVRLDGMRLSILRSLARYLLLWLSIIPFGLGLLWVIVDDRRQGWHDKMVRTCVIYDWPAREDEGMRSALISRWENFRARGRRFRRPRIRGNSGP